MAQQDEPEFLALPDPTLINASVKGTGGVDQKDDNELTSAAAGASVVTTLQGGLGPPVTLTQTGTAGANIEGPTNPQSGTGPNAVNASFSLLNQQAVTGSLGASGSNNMTTAVKGGRTYGLASSGPDSINTTLLETVSFTWAGPTGNASAEATSSGEFTSPNFGISWTNGHTLFTQYNSASTVTDVPPDPKKPNTTAWDISTPVTLSVYPSVSHFTIGFSGNITSVLSGTVIGTNSEEVGVGYTATLAS